MTIFSLSTTIISQTTILLFLTTFQPALAQSSPAQASPAPASSAQPSIPIAPGTTGGALLQDADLQQRLQRIDATVNKRVSSLNIPGYCLTVIKAGKVVFHKAYGFANLQQRQPTTNDTVFGIASLTKTFTALTLLSLVDKGLVGLEDPLSKYIAGLTPPYRSLTIRQLASMTAGVPAQLSAEVLWKDQLEILDHTPLAAQPGSTFLYSNYSYRLLGSVIRKVTGRDYLEVVRQTILDPLGMSSTATTVLLQPTGRVARGYRDDTEHGRLHEIEYKNPAISFSAGMLASTANDLVNFVSGLLSGRIISEQGYKTMWIDRPPLSTGKPSEWAFGWSSGRNQNLGGQYVVSMNGGTAGVASTIIILPQSNSAVIALCNLRKPAVYDIARTTARLAFSNTPNPETEEEQPDRFTMY